MLKELFRFIAKGQFVFLKRLIKVQIILVLTIMLPYTLDLFHHESPNNGTFATITCYTQMTIAKSVNYYGL